MKSNKPNIIIYFSFLGILILSTGLFLHFNSSSKKQLVDQNIKITAIVDSVRTTVIDSMQQVMQNLTKEVIPIVSTKPTRQIELYDLINLFTPSKTINYDLLDWKTEANNPAINWLTNGIETDNDGFYRAGNVVVSINKQVIECLDKTSHTCKWDLILLGPHGGYTSFEISSVHSQALGKMDIEELFKGRKFVATILKTDEFDNKTYQLTFPQRKPIDITVQWSCGSGGCSVTLKCETLES